MLLLLVFSGLILPFFRQTALTGVSFLMQIVQFLCLKPLLKRPVCGIITH